MKQYKHRFYSEIINTKSLNSINLLINFSLFSKGVLNSICVLFILLAHP